MLTWSNIFVYERNKPLQVRCKKSQRTYLGNVYSKLIGSTPFHLDCSQLSPWTSQFRGITHDYRADYKSKWNLEASFNWALRHEGILGEWKYSSTHSLTSLLRIGERSASRPGRFTPRERVPGIHWTVDWVGPRAVLDAVVKTEIHSPRRESNPRQGNAPFSWDFHKFWVRLIHEKLKNVQ
jgi:hypothetical protein